MTQDNLRTSPSKLVPRQRDRRQAFADLLGALTRAMDRRQDVSLMRGVFEQMARRMVPVRAIQLRDNASRWTRRDDLTGAEAVTLDVPGVDAGSAGVLEAAFDPSSGLGEWDFQQLGACAHLGALVLEIERLRLELVRSAVPAAPRPPRDAVAPLIGTTATMQELRAAIERVAATDFTILIEGSSDPQ